VIVSARTPELSVLTNLQHAEVRIAQASVEQLDQIGERLLTAQSMDEALG
jgi:hypothetical protein